MSKKNVNKRTPISATAGVSSGDTNTDNSSRSGFYAALKRQWIVVLIVGFISLGALGAGLKYLDEDAKREIAKRSAATPLNPVKNESLLNSVNPFLPTPTPTPAPQLSKEYISTPEVDY